MVHAEVNYESLAELYGRTPNALGKHSHVPWNLIACYWDLLS